MKILIICRHIFPMQAPRSFRATELAKEFARQGHDVVLYAVLGKYDYRQFEKQYGVVVKNIPTRLATSASDGTGRYTLIDKILTHSLKYLIEYPDIEFAFRVPRIIKREGLVDMLITIAVPHPIHWGAAFAKRSKRFPKCWISDCGDPFMGNPFVRHPKYLRLLERYWERRTDHITVPIWEARHAYSAAAQKKISVIPQGFSFDGIKLSNKKYSDDYGFPCFVYAGAIYKGMRDPAAFLEYLESLDYEFLFVVYTRNKDFFAPYKEILKNRILVNDYIPRSQLILELSKYDFLINIKNPNAEQSPSKIIDYLLSGTPIVDISTHFIERDQFEAALYHKKYPSNYSNIDITQFEISNVAKQFIALSKTNIEG